MRISLSKIILLAFIITLSISIGHISKIITVNFDVLHAAALKHRNDSLNHSPEYGFPIADSPDHVLWFLQVSFFYNYRWVIKYVYFEH